MRMKGHAIHDAAQYVPKLLFDYWLRRDPIARMEKYLVEGKNWLTKEVHSKLVSEVDAYLADERAKAEASPMPDPAEDAKHQGVYCDPSCHDIKPKYAPVKFGTEKKNVKQKSSEAAVHLK
jgi:TPP-dependent pyruvate/acetoin dehydrogenase alpha subunit